LPTLDKPAPPSTIDKQKAEDEESDESDSEDQPQAVKNRSKAVVSSFPTFKPPSTTATAQAEAANEADIVDAFDAPLALITPPQKAEPKTTTTNPMTPENVEKMDKLLEKWLRDEITVDQFERFSSFIPGMEQRHSTFFKGEGQVRGFLNNTFSRALHWFVALPFQKPFANLTYFSRALHWFVALPFQKPFANLTCSFCFSQAGRQHRTRFGYPIADGSRQQ